MRKPGLREGTEFVVDEYNGIFRCAYVPLVKSLRKNFARVFFLQAVQLFFALDVVRNDALLFTQGVREHLLLRQSTGATRALCRLLKRMLLPDGVSGVKALKLSFPTYAFNFTFAYLLAFSGVALPF